MKYFTTKNIIDFQEWGYIIFLQQGFLIIWLV